jgi:hypothetical protein
MRPQTNPSMPARVEVSRDLTKPNLAYYQERQANFIRRNPDKTPPDYYLEFGNKYVHEFAALTEKQLSAKGIAWRNQTLQRLQLAMEEKAEKDPEGFAALELDGDKFTQFAYATHSNAYLGEGKDAFNHTYAGFEKPIDFFDLPDQDLKVILGVPSFRDKTNPEALRAALKTMEKERIKDVIRSAFATAELSERRGFLHRILHPFSR